MEKKPMIEFDPKVFEKALTPSVREKALFHEAMNKERRTPVQEQSESVLRNKPL